jgi:hypothetical protein
MTEEIQREIDDRQRTAMAQTDIHGQEGAMPGTAAGAPTDEELRITSDDLLHAL